MVGFETNLLSKVASEKISLLYKKSLFYKCEDTCELSVKVVFLWNSLSEEPANLYHFGNIQSDQSFCVDVTENFIGWAGRGGGVLEKYIFQVYIETRIRSWGKLFPCWSLIWRQPCTENQTVIHYKCHPCGKWQNKIYTKHILSIKVVWEKFLFEKVQLLTSKKNTTCIQVALGVVEI